MERKQRLIHCITVCIWLVLYSYARTSRCPLVGLLCFALLCFALLCFALLWLGRWYILYWSEGLVGGTGRWNWSVELVGGTRTFNARGKNYHLDLSSLTTSSATFFQYSSLFGQARGEIGQHSTGLVQWSFLPRTLATSRLTLPPVASLFQYRTGQVSHTSPCHGRD